MNTTNQRCLIIRNAYSYDFGGGERFPVLLAEQIQKQAYSPVVISSNQKLLAYASSKGITHKKGPWWSKQYWSGTHTALFPIYLVWQLYLFFWYVFTITSLRVRVVHPQSRDDFIAATLAGRLLGKTVVWTDHADLKYVYQNHRSFVKNPVGKLVYAVSKLAHYVTLVSYSEYKLVEATLGHTPPKNYRVVHNGVPFSNITDKPTHTLLTFATTSRLVQTKGLYELIEAFKKLSKTTPAQLLIFGEGPEEADIKKQANGHANIQFKGHVNDIEEQLKTCDVFVHPSHHEGFSLSIVEAAKLGLPIIACNVGGNPEIVANEVNGLLVPPKNTEALYQAMQQLASDPVLRKKFGSEARKTYEENFVFETIVTNAFLKLYKNKKPFRILFDANPIVNGNKSGIGYYSYYLIDAIAKKYPYDVQLTGHYFNFLGKKQQLHLPNSPNISYKQSRLIPGKLLSLTRKLHFQPPLELFFKQRADAALFTNFVSLPSLFGIPTYNVVHDLCYEDVPSYVAKKNQTFLHAFVPASIKRAKKVITISEFSKAAIHRHYSTPLDKIFITPIPPVQLKHTIKKPSIINGKYILFLGNLEPRKNILSLVKGYKLLPPAIQKQYSLVLAGGTGWYFEETMDYIRACQKEGLSIILTGYVNDEQRESLYQNASLYALASHYEGFGMPILEAMSYGIPTAVSDIPVFKEIATDSSSFFDKDDPAHIASVIKETLTNAKLRKKLITKGHELVAAYDWDDVATMVYNELLS